MPVCLALELGPPLVINGLLSTVAGGALLSTYKEVESEHDNVENVEK